MIIDDYKLRELQSWVDTLVSENVKEIRGALHNSFTRPTTFDPDYNVCNALIEIARGLQSVADALNNVADAVVRRPVV